MTTELSVEVTHPGLLTSIQDPGRRGVAFYGLPPSGWLDPPAAQLANRLVGNSVEAPLLECNLLPVGLRFGGSGRLVLTGADMGWRLDGRPLERNTVHRVKAGNELNGRPSTNGARAYVAVGGLLQCAAVYGSAATDLSTGIGGIDGRRLVTGDRLTFRDPQPPAPSTSGRLRPLDYNAIAHIGVRRGPEWDRLAVESRHPFTAGPFRLTAESNRMGARLAGPDLTCACEDMPSVPVVPGVVQMPPFGQPIVILQDGQTTGGYPRIAIIPEGELGRFNQLRPGQSFRFVFDA